MYDIIGDIHGFAAPLKALLAKLGYESVGGVWFHPRRKVIFLGDFVDRGPAQVEVVQLVQAMVEAGSALAVMGNHELNAVMYATPDPADPARFLRPHNDKNRHHHRAFLEQAGEGSALHRSIIDWFKRLPLYLELPGLRCVHACWHPQHVRTLGAYTDRQARLRDEAWSLAADREHELYGAVETLLKGLEIPLPTGFDFTDQSNIRRRNIRTEWWNLDAITYRDLAMVPESEIDQIPHEPVPDDILPGYAGDKPVFVGHYWLKGRPRPLNDHVACLDYSVVDAHHGKLAAYRWDGETRLRDDSFVWVDR